MSETTYRYTPGKSTAGLRGVPRRDLTAADVTRLARQGLIADVERSGLYEKAKAEPVKPEKAEKPEKPVKQEGGE